MNKNRAVGTEMNIYMLGTIRIGMRVVLFTF